MQKHVRYLCSNKLAGRLTGSHGEKLAAKYIEAEFQRYGLEPAGDKNSYFQRFPFNKTQQGHNVVARLRVAPHAKSFIVIGAHLDHLGHGESNDSRASDEENGQIHPGADDNASGIASMLAAAAELSDLKAHGKLQGNKDIIFAAWSGEEFGILGSSYFVKQHRPIAAAINLDMVGHFNNKLIIQGTGSSTNWAEIIASSQLIIPITMQNDPYLPTDATAFYLEGIPSINLFTGAQDTYHTPRDTPDTLNYEGLRKISKVLVALIVKLETKEITFHEVKKTRGNSGSSLKIYLGTIPDYANTDVPGVKLAGVAKDSPAKLAGVRKGDVIIKVAGQRINDIYDYTDALNRLPAKKRTTLVVIREGKINKLQIIPSSRA